MKRKQEIQMNQDCAEVMIMKAAQRVLGVNLRFQYPKIVEDAQVDVSPAFTQSPDHQKRIWLSGGMRQSLEQDLETLEQDKVYFLRTGTQQGAGHWQMLYFDATKLGWISYSSEKNNYQITANGFLTEAGIGLLSPHAKWGLEKGEYLFMLVEVSEQNLVNAANFLYDYRTIGEVRAVANVFSGKENFYPQIMNTQHKKNENTATGSSNPQRSGSHSAEVESEQQGNVQKDNVAMALVNIIDVLIDNLQDKRNGRLTSRNNEWKRDLLTQIKNNIQRASPLAADASSQYIEEIRTVCSKKRNAFHFWSTPHSVTEFKHLLSAQQFVLQSTDLGPK
jgi:hypothetical protein